MAISCAYYISLYKKTAKNANSLYKTVCSVLRESPYSPFGNLWRKYGEIWGNKTFLFYASGQSVSESLMNCWTASGLTLKWYLFNLTHRSFLSLTSCRTRGTLMPITSATSSGVSNFSMFHLLSYIFLNSFNPTYSIANFSADYKRYSPFFELFLKNT